MSGYINRNTYNPAVSIDTYVEYKRLLPSTVLALVWNYQPRSQLCCESVGSYLIRPQPLFDWASGQKGEMVDQTMASSYVKLLWECLCPGFHEWGFPLHGVWGDLA